jgi:diketogulonate reductase-like aldo/keto reductase
LEEAAIIDGASRLSILFRVDRDDESVIDIPRLGLGTWLRDGDEGFHAIVAGLELGYRHLDTAQTYGTEAHIGRAIRASGVPREEVFVTTKVGDINLARQDFLPSLRRSLDLMASGPADLTLIHWPFGQSAASGRSISAQPPDAGGGASSRPATTAM